MKRSSIALALLTVGVLLLAACGGSPDDPWEGSWRELDTAESYTLTLTSTESGDYLVEYPRSFLVPFHAYPDDATLVVWGENTDHVVWVLHYDADSDRLSAVDRDGSERIDFERAEQ